VVEIDHNMSDWYQQVRSQSLSICDPLELEDHQIQPMDDASPPKWHLAHTSWFFETFLLKPYAKGYQPLDSRYETLFNSYYNGVGSPFPRSNRGNLSRPTLNQVHQYRQHVDSHMQHLLGSFDDEDVIFRTTLGLHHEQQHQELMFTDLKYNFGHNPLMPAYTHNRHSVASEASPLTYSLVEEGLYQIGNNAQDNFCFDNETPSNQVWLNQFEIADRVVTNSEYQEFVDDGGYHQPELWLSDAWALMQKQSPDKRWSGPLYWRRDGQHHEYQLSGCSPLNPMLPVCHVSAYEALAYTKWLSMQTGISHRLPTEAEWEVSAADEPIEGNFAESGLFHPAPAKNRQFFGDVWEWTSSSYGPYPGYQEFAGQLGEYNGKFMANQLVLRGGSCVTPESHIRLTYRNFFYPPDRWQFSGIRLVRDTPN